jgi:uncharacterized damage-inducible protein DinB
VKLTRISMALFLVLFCVRLVAQPPPSADSRAIAETLERSLRGSERELVDAAEAMPEEKYSFAPTDGEFKGVRTFGEQVKHVAAVNFAFWSGIQGQKPPVELGGQNGPESLKTKAEILRFLKDSYAYAHKAIAAADDYYMVEPIKSAFADGTTTRLSMAIGALIHAQDHYGQMAEYLRMNRIVPPASR